MYFDSQSTLLLLASLLANAAIALSAIAPRDDGCTFTDFQSFQSGKAKCTKMILNGIAVPAGQTLDISLAKENVEIEFQGKTTFGYKEWAGPLVTFRGTGLKVTAAAGAIIDGGGPRYWDKKGGHGGKTKPAFLYLHQVKASTFTGLHVIDSPVQTFHIANSNGVTMDQISIVNENAASMGAYNTDGFLIGHSDDITITNSNVKNWDDCIAVIGGSNMKFTDIKCDGSHGATIGGLGDRPDAQVSNVIFERITLSNGDNGARIKTVKGGSGSVENITFKNITLQNIRKYGIVVEQNYLNSGSSGEPTNGVKITKVDFENVKGDVAPQGTPIYIMCGQGSCSDFTSQAVHITGGKGGNTCKNMQMAGC
ncbi:unnamed protein product [Sympodiomycopsis kandeliae]